MKSLVFNFFLLILEISFNFTLNTVYKCNKFFKILLEKSLKFVLYKKSNLVLLNPNFVLLLIEVDFIICYKKDILMPCSTSRIEIIFALSIKLIILYIQAFII